MELNNKRSHDRSYSRCKKRTSRHGGLCGDGGDPAGLDRRSRNPSHEVRLFTVPNWSPVCRRACPSPHVRPFLWRLQAISVREDPPTPSSTRPFLNSLLKLHIRNGGADSHTSNNRNCSQLHGLNLRHDGRTSSSFLLPPEPRTDLPFAILSLVMCICFSQHWSNADMWRVVTPVGTCVFFYRVHMHSVLHAV